MEEFNAPTSIDYTMSEAYAFERKKILMFNEYLAKYPNILSHTFYTIQWNNRIRWSPGVDPDENIYISFGI